MYGPEEARTSPPACCHHFQSGRQQGSSLSPPFPSCLPLEASSYHPEEPVIFRSPSALVLPPFWTRLTDLTPFSVYVPHTRDSIVGLSTGNAAWTWAERQADGPVSELMSWGDKVQNGIQGAMNSAGRRLKESQLEGYGSGVASEKG